MAHIRNPFTASLGATPPELVGREELLEDITFALENGPGAHERISVITGPRGIGKTALLNAVEDRARGMSWWVFSETATNGFVSRLRDSIYRVLDEQVSQNKTQLTELTLGSFSIGLSKQESYQPELTFRDVVTQLARVQSELDSKFTQDPVGILISLDELHHSNKDEIIDFSAAVQHFVREGLNVAVMMAGIPSAIKPLLAAENGANPITFLRRANRIELSRVSDQDVRAGLLHPVAQAGLGWEEKALELAVRLSSGYPFQIQLVGQWSFQAAVRDKTDLIKLEHAQQGSAKALQKLGQLVHEPALADLSEKDRAFLRAMALDDGPSHINELAQRLGVSAQYAGIYRRRLVDAEMIEIPRTAHVDFALPYLREYLREHADDGLV